MVLVRKGFVHMIEVIVVVVMAFFSFFQFSYITTPDVDWQRTKLNLMGNDILFTLDERGVNWFNGAEVQNEIEDLIGSKNIIYGLKLNNVIKQNITLGCLCTDEQRDAVEAALRPNPMKINDENINYDIIASSSPEIVFNLNYDAVIIVDYISLDAYSENINNYLRDDRGIIELFKLSESQTTGIQENIFGLSWSNDDLSSGNGVIEFSPQSRNAGYKSYTIYKYFYSFPNTTGDGHFGLGQDFTNYIGSGSGVIPSGNDQRKIFLEERDTGSAAGILNYEINEMNGRTVWMPMGIPDNEMEKNLLKSVVSWAAGSTEIISNPKMKNSAVVSKYRVYNKDMFQIVKIDLLLDYL